MTPRDVDSLSDVELRAFWEYAEKETRDLQREARKAARKR